MKTQEDKMKQDIEMEVKHQMITVSEDLSFIGVSNSSNSSNTTFKNIITSTVNLIIVTILVTYLYFLMTNIYIIKTIFSCNVHK